MNFINFLTNTMSLPFLQCKMPVLKQKKTKMPGSQSINFPNLAQYNCQKLKKEDKKIRVSKLIGKEDNIKYQVISKWLRDLIFRINGTFIPLHVVNNELISFIPKEISGGICDHMQAFGMKDSQVWSLEGYDLTKVDLSKIPSHVKSFCFKQCFGMDLSQIPKTVTHLYFEGCPGIDLSQIRATVKFLSFKGKTQGLDLSRIPHDAVEHLSFTKCSEVDLSQVPNQSRRFYFNRCSKIDLWRIPKLVSWVFFNTCSKLDLRQLPNNITDVSIEGSMNGMNLKELPKSVRTLFIQGNIREMQLNKLSSSISTLTLISCDSNGEKIDLSQLSRNVETLCFEGDVATKFDLKTIPSSVKTVYFQRCHMSNHCDLTPDLPKTIKIICLDPDSRYLFKSLPLDDPRVMF